MDTFKVDKENFGQRLDVYLAKLVDLSRSQIKNLIVINWCRTWKSEKLRKSHTLTIIIKRTLPNALAYWQGPFDN